MTKKSLRNIKISLLVIVSFSPIISYAGDSEKLKVGLNYSLDFQQYKGKKTTSSLLPVVFYDNQKQYIEGSELGLYLLNDDKNQLRLNAYYDGSYFEPSGAVSALKTRKWSVMSGASYMRITPFGGFKAQIGTDILSRSKGTVATLSYLAELDIDKWSIYPEIGYQWNDRKYNQYYYGISQSEAENSGLSVYTPKDSIQPYASLNFSYDLTKTWNIVGGVDINYLSKQQYNSPMVKNRLDISPSLGFIFKF
ncbi:MipA/OmpV family protein [Acinetobacter sp.]|uniref:MipA/OmpV family protein n=1 Tax=Acinetobacter sp. TaxID=472 RepID=UPI0031D13B80